MSISSLSNEALVEELKKLRRIERETSADILLYLSEIDRRQFYRDLGYSSLFSFCREALGYSEGGAQRRILAARALKDNPEIYKLLREGKVSLCSVANVSKVIGPGNKESILSEIQGKSKLEVQKIAASYQGPVFVKKKETIKVLSVIDALPLFQETTPETCYTVTLQVDDEFMALVDKAKASIGPQPMSEVLRRTLKAFVTKKFRKSRRPLKRSRYIPQSIRADVYNRDNHQCAFVSGSGHRCQETHGLQIDHIIPFSKGGSNTASNLRLLCRAHNQLLAEKLLGKEFMRSKRKSPPPVAVHQE